MALTRLEPMARLRATNTASWDWYAFSYWSHSLYSRARRAMVTVGVGSIEWRGGEKVSVRGNGANGLVRFQNSEQVYWSCVTR